jgi:hypothetical protein
MTGPSKKGIANGIIGRGFDVYVVACERILGLQIRRRRRGFPDWQARGGEQLRHVGGAGRKT